MKKVHPAEMFARVSVIATGRLPRPGVVPGVPGGAGCGFGASGVVMVLRFTSWSEA